MDYESYVLANYTIPTSNIASGDYLFFYSQGGFDIVDDIDYDIYQNDFETTVYYGANYYNRFLASGGKNLVSFAYCFSDRDIIFFNSNKLDYAVYGSSNATGTLYGYQFAEGDSIDDLSSINNYYNQSGSNPFSDFNDEQSLYGNYQINLTNQKPYAVFDYYNLKYENRNDAVITARGENMSFYFVMNEIIFTSTPNNIYFSYGAPYYTIANDEYTRGVSAGYSGGRVDGYNDGYRDGVNSSGVEVQTATAFSYIGTAFTAVTPILEAQVLPGISIGTLVSIPLVLILIATIFKLVRK